MNKSKRKCSRCGRQGHTITTCYAKTDVNRKPLQSSSCKYNPKKMYFQWTMTMGILFKI